MQDWGPLNPGVGSSTEKILDQQYPTVLAPGTALWKAGFPWTGAGGGEDGFGKIQAHYIYRALYFYCDYVSSTSDHQAVDPGGREPLL